MTYKIRGVRVEEYAYYVNKLRQNVGLKTWIWSQIVTSQRAHPKYKWPPYATEWNLPHENFLRAPLSCRVVLFRLYCSLFTLTISQKLSLFILLYLLMILISICQIPVLIFFKQLLTLNYVKLTTGWEPTSFLLRTIRLILCY